MAKDNELLIKINGSAKQFIDEIDRVKQKTKDLEENLTKVAKVSGIAFTALAGAVGATVLKFSEFEKTFSNVQTLLDKSSFSTKSLSEGIDGLKKGVLALGAESGDSFESLNTGLFNLVSAGVSADDAISTLSAATKLAIAGATDTNTAVKALTATLTSFGSEAGTAEEISQKFFTAQKFGVTTVGELANEFNKVAATSKALGLSFDETLASLSSLTANGAKPTAVAATELKALLNSLILVQSKLGNESAAVQDALSLQNIQSRGLVASLDLLKQATNGDVVEMQRLIGSSEALNTVLSLTGTQSDLVKKQIAEMSDEVNRAATFNDALATKQATTEQSLNRMKASIESVAIVFGEAFAPTINAAAQSLTEIAKKFNELDRSTIQTLVTITKWAIALTGLTAAGATAAVIFLKLRSIFLALNSALAIGSNAIKLYNFALVSGKRAAELFSVGLRLATTTLRGFLGATGLGLLLVVLGYAITDFKSFKAVATASLTALGSVIVNFTKLVKDSFGGLGELLLAVFSFDKGKIQTSINSLKTTISNGFSGLGKEAASAYSTAYQDSLKESEANEVQQVKSKNQKLIEEHKKLGTAKAEITNLQNAEKIEKQKENEAQETAVKVEALSERQLIEQELANEKKLNDDTRRKQFLKDEIKHGQTVAALNQFLASEEVNNAKTAASELVQLTNSKNKQLRAIGKAAAITEIAISTATGAINAYKSLAGIPYVGPFLGAAAAAAVVAYGAERTSQVRSAAQGGVVPNSIGGSRDRVPTLLEPGEIIVPKALAPNFVQTFGRGDNLQENNSSQMNVTLGFRDEAFQIIEKKLIERRSIGIGVI